MKSVLLSLRRQPLETLLAISLAALSIQLYFGSARNEPNTSEMMLYAEQGNADISLRTADFPNTFIRSIHVDLTSPNHWVRLIWSGPSATKQKTGPFRSSPGRGTGDNNCDDLAETTRGRSNCTPKGTMKVEGFSDFMSTVRICKFVTWFHSSREIAFHSHPNVPAYPSSSGCVRLSEHAAQLIHNNSIVGKTEVVVGGTWTPPPASESSEI